MSLFITSLNSGSNGNCYYVGNSEEGVLIDAGISCRETEKRMQRSGLPMSLLKAIFISHEHSDHISGVTVLARKYQLPVYITDSTLLAGKLELAQLSGIFRAYEPVQIGGLLVTGFPKRHDASEPHSFIIEYKGIKVGVFTDIGMACDHVIRHFKQCHAAFLEANYDEEMLDKGNYPYYLKNRIKNGWGHLSNTQALQLFKDHRPAYMSHLLLSHLSKNNNCPDLVGKLFNQHAGNTLVVVASRHAETPVYTIHDSKKSVVSSTAAIAPKQEQLSLF